MCYFQNEIEELYPCTHILQKKYTIITEPRKSNEYFGLLQCKVRKLQNQKEFQAFFFEIPKEAQKGLLPITILSFLTKDISSQLIASSNPCIIVDFLFEGMCFQEIKEGLLPPSF